jgi:hypothetical protein
MVATMDTIWQLVVGFLLTTVLGGLLGTYLQRRSWNQQNEAQLREAERHRAGEVCQAVSGLLDRRRYRMLRLFHAVDGHTRGAVSADALAEKLASYDEVLYQWNDLLNVNLALVETSFGQLAREQLERAYATYEAVGASIEDAYRQAAQGSRPGTLAELGKRLGELDQLAYDLSLLMMTQLLNGTVGRRAPHPPEAPAAPALPPRP